MGADHSIVNNPTLENFQTMLIQGQNMEFEFDSVNPGSPNSPADHLFSNGKLLPHAFPLQHSNTISLSRISTSRTSSVSSSSSRSSSCSSSARTSTSEPCERRPIRCGSQKVVKREKYQAALLQQYGSSQRWQFIAPAAPLSRQTSRQRKTEMRAKKEGQSEAQGGFGRRIFGALVAACEECHAIRPSRKKSTKVAFTGNSNEVIYEE
ncbi:hypothetical protein NMG60_11037050 [Bertholletia excelsa]